MAYIATCDETGAAGALAAQYEAARRRAGRVYNIVKVMSQNPPVLEASMGLYARVMKGPSPLSRALREMVAVVVSKANGCHY